MIWTKTNVEFDDMMASSNGNIFRFTGPLCGEFLSHRGVPLTKASDAGFRCFYQRLNKWFSKQSRRRWSETPSCSLWRHCNGAGKDIQLVVGRQIASELHIYLYYLMIHESWYILFPCNWCSGLLSLRIKFIPQNQPLLNYFPLFTLTNRWRLYIYIYIYIYAMFTAMIDILNDAPSKRWLIGLHSSVTPILCHINL